MEIRDLSSETMLDEAQCCCEPKAIEREFKNVGKAKRFVDDLKRAAVIKIGWLKEMIEKGLQAKIAYEGETAVGFIEYMPIEESIYLEGNDLFLLNCIHTEQGFEKKGYGSALVQAMIDGLKDRTKGIVASISIAYTRDLSPFFARFGFENFKCGKGENLIKKFTEDVKPPLPTQYEPKYQFKMLPGKISVTTFWNCTCPVAIMNMLRAKDVCAELKTSIVFNEFCIDSRDTLKRYGIGYGTFFNGKDAEFYGPVEKDEIRRKIDEVLKGKKQSI